MSWLSQARMFFQEVRHSKSQEVDTEQLDPNDLEYVTSVSEARLLTTPQGASFLIAMTLSFLVGLLIWSVVMSVDEVVKAQGKVIPSRQIQNIQSLDGGIIKEIKVSEGQQVAKDDLLVLIDDVAAKSNLQENEQNYFALKARLEAMDAGLSGKHTLVFSQELQNYPGITRVVRDRFNATWDEFTSRAKEMEQAVKQREKELEAAQSALKTAKIDVADAKEELALNRKAYDDRIISKVEFLNVKHQTNERIQQYNRALHEVPKSKAALEEANQKLESYKAQKVSEIEKEREDVKAKLQAFKAKSSSLKAKVAYATIMSPVDGIVKKINFNTIGGVVRPGEVIMEVVPTDDTLLIEAKVKPKDIGFVNQGLDATVKLTAFDFSTYGGLEGKVEFVSADTITDKKGESFFVIRIRTTKNFITDKKGINHVIIPGMQSEADIVVDKKNILQYILKPMLK
jgi:membrane fusion protein, adhesin transport system